MPAFSATAPGKIILFGEHAVVYGQPALAVPLEALHARAVVHAEISGQTGEIWLEAPEIGLSSSLGDLAQDHPLRTAVAAVAGEDRIHQVPACRIVITSTIPPSSGLGSSAAVSAALIRAFSAFLGKRLSDDEVSARAFEVEKIHHGNPSGIDNSVVVHQAPVYYQQGLPIEFLSIAKPFELLIADSGLPGQTRQAVEKVRAKSEEDPLECRAIFNRIGEIARQARDLLQTSSCLDLGPLMNENQTLLRELGVSTRELDELVNAAQEAGALGAKLSGGGLGGHIIVMPGDQHPAVEAALQDAGAARVLSTIVRA